MHCTQSCVINMHLEKLPHKPKNKTRQITKQLEKTRYTSFDMFSISVNGVVFFPNKRAS